MSLFTPRPKTLRALRSLGAELDEASSTPMTPRVGSNLDRVQRTPATAFGLGIGPSAILDPGVIPRRRPRFVVAASLCGLALATGLASVVLRSNQRTVASNDLPMNPGAGSPYVVPGFIPEGLCLASHSTENTSHTDEYLTLSLESEKGGSIELYGTSVKMSGYVRRVFPLVGERLTINGKPAFRAVSEAGQTLMWSLGDFDLYAASYKTTAGELIEVAKRTTVDNKKAKLAYKGSKFKTLAGSQRPITQMSLEFGACQSDSKSNTNGQRLFLSAVQLPYLSEAMVSQFTGEIRTLRRTNASALRIKEDSFAFNGFTRTAAWSEGTTIYFAGDIGLSPKIMDQFLSNLRTSTQAEIDALTNEPGAAGQVIDSFETGESITHNVQIRGSNYSVNTLPAEANTKLCTAVDLRLVYCKYSLGGSIRPKMDVALYPRLASLSWAVVVDASIVTAKALFPDGHVDDIPSVVDERAPTLRVFVWSQKDTDPRPVNIQYLNAKGKVIHEQKS